jgi:decaprenylphospho-beta-D-ribofuranose 2-oxidase
MSKAHVTTETLPYPLVTLEGFGRYRQATQSYARPERVAELKDALSNTHTVIARGAGKSYGDAALNDGHTVISLERLDRMLGFDPATNILTAEAGVLVLDVMRFALARGLTMPVAPGSSAISLGGCAAFDIHSKNHWREGGFGDWLVGMRIMNADGEIVSCSPHESADLFYATVGGLGLTGIIVELDMRLVPIGGTNVRNTAIPFDGVSQLFERLDRALPSGSHCVAWMDLLNYRSPKGVIIASNYCDAAGGEMNRPGPHIPDLAPWYRTQDKPVDLLAMAFNTLSNRAFNVAFARRHRVQPERILSLRPFLFPWDAIPRWNRLYGRKGFVEYQCCVPSRTAAEAFGRILEHVLARRHACPVYFAAVKKMRQGVGMLSFPLDGYSLLLDFPVSRDVWSLLDELDSMVMHAGGRVFLAKDGRLSAAMFARMYSQLEQWKVVRRSIDPRGRFQSDMARRLGLVTA